MKNVKFMKNKYQDFKGTHVYIEDFLFKTKKEKINKTIEILKVLSFNIERYEGEILISSKDINIINELHNLKCHYELTGTYKHLFNNIDEKYKVILNNTQINEFVTFVLVNDLTFDGQGYNNNHQILLQIFLNDNEGSHIIFNNDFYEIAKYKQLIKDIFKK